MAQFVSQKNLLKSKVASYDKAFLPIITKENPDKIFSAFWGIPIELDPMTKRSKAKFSVNSRIETFRKLKSFRNYAEQICILPVAGFYEFQHKFLYGKDVSMLHRLTYENENIFGLLGIYGKFLNANNEEILAFSLLTTSANQVMEKIHNKNIHDSRMPIAFSPKNKKKVFESLPEEIANWKIPYLAENLEPEKDQPTLF